MNTDQPQTDAPEKIGNPPRRDFLRSVSTAMIAETIMPKEIAPPRNYGLAYTSFPVRMRQSVQAMARKGPAILAEKFIELCESFGGRGCQMDIAQLASTEPDYLKRIRSMLEAKNMYMELSISGRTLADPEAFADAARAAHQLGVSRLRTALLSGRRYEDFPEMKKWKEFVDRSQQTLRQIEPHLKQHKLLVGVENHKDWLADELAEMLKRVSSPYLGACIDFGNNLSLLEESVEVAEKLAPYAVTTHLKDMAITSESAGFQMSEVPLGQGFLPLAKIIDTLRRGRSDVHFCLEMITRDPLKVPYLEDNYWTTYEKRDTVRVQKFEREILKKVASKGLPIVSTLTPDRMLAAEDENLRRSASYARETLGL